MTAPSARVRDAVYRRDRSLRELWRVYVIGNTPPAHSNECSIHGTIENGPKPTAETVAGA